MLYTKEQVEMMLQSARTTTESFETIMDEMEPVYLPDEDEVNDAGYDEAGPDLMETFKQGGEWVRSIVESRYDRVNDSAERMKA